MVVGNLIDFLASLPQDAEIILMLDDNKSTLESIAYGGTSVNFIGGIVNCVYCDHPTEEHLWDDEGIRVCPDERPDSVIVEGKPL